MIYGNELQIYLQIQYIIVTILIPYRILYVASIIVAPLITLNLVWDLADTFNALMAIPNLIALLLLSNVIVKETKKYINDLDKIDDTEIPIIHKQVREFQ